MTPKGCSERVYKIRVKRNSDMITVMLKYKTI